MYPATFLFREASAAYVFLAVFNIFIGVAFLFVTFMLDYFRSSDVRHTRLFFDLPQLTQYLSFAHPDSPLNFERGTWAMNFDD